ncbi:MAG: preprotein translocase subunit SecY, partial [Deferribacterales bacterium]
LGEKITEKGIGNGMSMIIFAGIVAAIPTAVLNTYRLMQTGELQIITLIGILFIVVAVTAGIVFVEASSRRIPIQYIKRGTSIRGNVATSYLPLKLNTSGVIPIIFAASIVSFPSTLASFSGNEYIKQIGFYLSPSHFFYYVFYSGLIIFFCYFYTSIIFNPTEIADNIQRSGGVVPGKRPGSNTAEFIDYTLSRLTFAGAIYLTIIAIMPQVILKSFNVPFYFGGTSVLIVVGVAMDVVNKIESHLISHNYEGFLSKGRIKARGGTW